MVALSWCFGSLALFLSGAEGARKRRKIVAAPNTKFIADVPVFGYHAAHGGKAALGELESEAEQEWLLFLDPGTSDAQVQRLCEMNNHGCNLVGHPIGGVPFLEMRGTEVDLEQVIYGGGGAVKFVRHDQEDFLIPDIEEDVGVQGTTWGLNRIGVDARGRSGAGATIYVQDSGVRVSHQEFGGRAASALDLSSGSPVECNGDLNCAADTDGHGTFCAGSAAGATYGVAPGASVRAVKAWKEWNLLGIPHAWQYAAIDWVTVNGVRPAVLSLTIPTSRTLDSPEYTTAIDAAVNHGVTVVVAAGKQNEDACGRHPNSVASAITVGSTTSRDKRSSFSNYGACTNIWAPGSRVLSAGIRSDTSSSTKSGTHVAQSYVSGAAALVLSVDPTKKASAVLAELLDNAAMNVIEGLTFADTNALLYVGEGGAPPSPTLAPIPTPSVTVPEDRCYWWCSGPGGCLLDHCGIVCDKCQ